MSRKLVVEIVGSTAGLEKSFARASRDAKGFSNDIGKASRGALSAAVSFQGLGRAMAFSSAQFLGGAGIVFALKSTIEAAEESQRVLGQTSVAVGRAGLSWATYGKQIEAAALAQSNLSGFDDERLLGTFSKLLRTTGSVTEALKDNALAVNVARGANIELEKAAQIVGRASVGQAKGLVNIGIAARKGATGTELLALINQKFSGSAVAFGKTAVGAQERFRVAIENTQEALGKGALPALTLYLNKASDWLNQSKNQERIQRDVAEAVHVLGDAVKVAGTVVKAAADAFEAFSGVVGGSKHALELLAAVAAGFKALKLVDSLAGIGLAAQTSTGQVNVLRTRLIALRTLGVIGVTIAVGFEVAKGAHALDKFLGGTSFGKTLGIGEQLVSAADVKKLLAGGATPAEIAAKFGGFLDDSGIDALKNAKDAFAARAAKAAKAAAASNLFSGAVPTFATGPAFAPPKPVPGVGRLSPFAQANLDLSTAGLTDTTVDDLKALNTQHELLAKKIAVETDRLAKAPTAKAAKKFATELERLNGLDAAALSQIEALQKQSGQTPNDLAARRNTFFDNRISRLISQVQDAPIKDQIAKLQTIAGLVTARIAATKDVTRRLTLEDQLADVRRSIKSTSQGIAADAASLFDSTISRALDHVQDLPINKQIGQLTKISGQIAARIAATKDVQTKLALEDTLAGVKRTIVATGKSISDTAAQLFDSNLSRALDQITDLPVAKQIAQLKHIAAQITARIAATQDVERKRTLEDELLGVTRQIGGVKTQQAQDFIDSLSLNVTTAEATAGLADDFRTLNALKAGLEKLIAAGTDVAANKAKLADTIQKIAAKKADRGQQILDALSFSVTKAEATATLSDDLATLSALKRGLQKQISEGINIAANKATLFDTLQKIAAKKLQQGQDILAGLSFGVTKAGVTASLADDLAANAALQAALKKQIAGSSNAADLERQLFDAQRKQHDLERQVRQQARQLVADRLQLAVDRAAATPRLQDDLAARKAIVANIRDQIKTNGSTIKAQEDLLASLGDVKTIRQQIAQKALDALSFAFDRAAVTKSQQDDLKTLDDWKKGLRAQFKKNGDLLTLERGLFDISQKRVAVNRQIAQNRNDARNAAQFKALGLTATGADKVPGVQSLKAQLGSIGDAVTGSFLDTKKTRSMLAHLRAVLSGGLGVVGREVRSAVEKILSDFDQQLKNHAGDQTKFRHISAAKILAGQGLSPEQIRALTPRIAAIGPGGTVPRPTGQFAGAGGGVTITGPIHLHGVQNLREFEETIEKRARSRAASRRGAR